METSVLLCTSLPPLEPATRLACLANPVCFFAAAEKSAAAPQGVTSATRPAASAPPKIVCGHPPSRRPPNDFFLSYLQQRDLLPLALS
ncbi:hypothetical protein CDAR_524651 [Caerostris darwini]|uniref:Uncharacterized protein n=1 Tax=Caerostris darwini TaxID=1538125 RepID=A0AAV4QZU7_9ARAC|nr:hypothetical protein CDAR_524651 [Caerostris darwini]